MIIVGDCSGRLCNRLVLFAHACATAIESKQAFCHCMAEDVMAFAKLDSEILNKFNVSCIAKIPCWAFVLRIRQAFYDRIRPPNSKKYLATNVLRAQKMSHPRFLPHIILRWAYRDPVALVHRRNDICRILAPKDKYLLRPKTFMKMIPPKNTSLIGVHVRRGDYKQFNSGRYFFSDEEYARFMEMTCRSFSNGCRFVMVSDESLNENFFTQRGLDAHVFHGEDFREDLVMLSLCDYIMGPWSTFSWWAAYYGGIKLCHLHNRNDIVDATSFKEINGNEV